MILIGHVTKEGILAGPRVIEHMVDTVLQFEGERHYSYRILRATKNRFGSTNEIGIFEMHDDGMHEVKESFRSISFRTDVRRIRCDNRCDVGRDKADLDRSSGISQFNKLRPTAKDGDRLRSPPPANAVGSP